MLESTMCKEEQGRILKASMQCNIYLQSVPLHSQMLPSYFEHGEDWAAVATDSQSAIVCLRGICNLLIKLNDLIRN